MKATVVVWKWKSRTLFTFRNSHTWTRQAIWRPVNHVIFSWSFIPALIASVAVRFREELHDHQMMMFVLCVGVSLSPWHFKCYSECNHSKHMIALRHPTSCSIAVREEVYLASEQAGVVIAKKRKIGLFWVIFLFHSFTPCIHDRRCFLGDRGSRPKCSQSLCHWRHRLCRRQM